MSEPTSATEILVVRPDRMGDVILSTPVLSLLKAHYSKSKITFMGRSSVLSLIEGLECVDAVMPYDRDKKYKGLRGFYLLYKEIKKRKFKIAVVLQSEWKIALALFLSGVRYRVGPWSKPHSFFLYNRGMRQRRSLVEMHEADYNMQLLRKLGIRAQSRTVLTKVYVSENVNDQARTWLVAKGVALSSEKKLIAVHPGMGGSALNWPESHYVELVGHLLEKGYQVLLTFGPLDKDSNERMRKVLSHSNLFIYDSDMPIPFLGALFKACDLVVAPSTGPLHLAVALQKPVVCVYPPIRVQSAIRWGPYLEEDSDGAVLVPEMYCGQDFKCKGESCYAYPCMRSVLVSQAIIEIERLLLRKKS